MNLNTTGLFDLSHSLAGRAAGIAFWELSVRDQKRQMGNYKKTGDREKPLRENNSARAFCFVFLFCGASQAERDGI